MALHCQRDWIARKVFCFSSASSQGFFCSERRVSLLECPSTGKEVKQHSRGIPLLFGSIYSCLQSLDVGVINPELQCYFFKSYLLFDVFISSRVFLRAVNQFTSVLNRFFLDQANFELQVIVTLFLDFLTTPVLKGRKNKQIPLLTDLLIGSMPVENVHSLLQKSSRMQSSSELQICG